MSFGAPCYQLIVSRLEYAQLPSSRPRLGASPCLFPNAARTSAVTVHQKKQSRVFTALLLCGPLRQCDSAFPIFKLASHRTINYCAVSQYIQHSTVVPKADFPHFVLTLFDVIHCENADCVGTGNDKKAHSPHITNTLPLVTEK